MARSWVDEGKVRLAEGDLAYEVSAGAEHARHQNREGVKIFIDKLHTNGNILW